MENEATTTAVTPKASEGIVGWIESVIITTSQTSVGQTLFKLIDSFLWVVEKSAQWSLPSHEIAAEENGKVFGKIELVRPLPWILFLPGLVILRIIRGGLNVGAFILGYPQIQPSGVVKFVQKGRRRLRAINLKAIKSTRRKICNNKAATPDEKSTTESVESPIHQEVKRKYSQVSSDEEGTDESENETFLSKLERFAEANSTDESDFNPAECSTETSTASSENEVEKEISITEVAELRVEANEVGVHEEEALLMTLENLLQKSNSKQTEETAEGVKRVDSSESKLQATSRATTDFINGEITSIAETSAKAVPEPSPAPEVINGVVAKKQTPQTAPVRIPEATVPAKAKTSISKENFSTMHEKKGNRYKKMGRKDVN